MASASSGLFDAVKISEKGGVDAEAAIFPVDCPNPGNPIRHPVNTAKIHHDWIGLGLDIGREGFFIAFRLSI